MSSRGRQDVETRVASMVGDILADRQDGLEFDRVEFSREGGDWFLRVFLDHPTGVTLEHCQEVSRALGEALDRDDPVTHSYSLEVSSPGLERPLRTDRDFDRFRGRLVALHFYRAIGGKKTLTGRLGGLDDDGAVVVETDAGVQRFERKEISKAHLAVDWSKGLAGATDDFKGLDDSGGDSQ